MLNVIYWPDEEHLEIEIVKSRLIAVRIDFNQGFFHGLEEQSLCENYRLAGESGEDFLSWKVK